MNKLFIVTFILYTTLFAAAGDVDYLIVENPAALHLLDAYEQRIPFEIKETLPAHMPFLILDNNHLLSDTYTRAIQATCNGFIYYLVKNREGRLLTEIPTGKMVSITNARVLSDTIQIKEGSLVALQSGGKQRQLAANELLLLVFQKNNRYYVKQLAPPGRYGWINVKQNNYRQTFTSKNLQSSEKAEFPLYLRNAIQAYFTGYNKQLEQLYAFFNRYSDKSRQSPIWILEASGNRITCTLSNLPAGTNYKESINHIIRRIQRIFPPGYGKIARTDDGLVIIYGKTQTL
jgi:hypothetical protein